MENKKIVLVVICILLVIFLPLTVIGFIFKDDRNLLDENPEHKVFYDGYIWFYDDADKFLSKYECQTEHCDFATAKIDDSEYQINYFRNGNLNSLNINDKYTMIVDGVLNYLFDYQTGKVINTYDTYKNYNTSLDNNYLIVKQATKDGGKWGVLSIDNVVSPIFPFEYDFIGLVNKIEDETLLTDVFVVLKDNNWYLVDDSNNVLTPYYQSEIIDYNENYVLVKNDESVKIYDYNGNEYMSNVVINDYLIKESYIGVISNNNLYIYEDFDDLYLVSIKLDNADSEIQMDLKDDKLDIIVNEEIVESIELN